MASFKVYCISKNKRPMCDDQIASTGSTEVITELVQGVMFSNDPTIMAAVVSGAIVEIGLAENQSLTASNLSSDITLVNGAAFPNRLQTAVEGIFHYDIDLYFTFAVTGGNTTGTDQLVMGPMINGVAVTSTIPSEDATVMRYGDTVDQSNTARRIQIDGNLNLNAGDAISIFVLPTVASAQTNLSPEFIRLRIFRLGTQT